MKFKRSLLILSAILIGVLIVVAGCVTAPTTPSIGGDVPSGGSVSIAHGAATTNDATPLLTISATGATYMAFSGNGTTWSSWVAYATSHITFNITTGEGCTTGEGTKTVYVKFKNDSGESIKYNDTVEYDITKPKLSTAVYSDANSSSTVNKGDTITFTFDDGMLTSTVTSTNVATSLLLSTGSYGTGATISWNTTGTICTVTLGTSPTIVYGTTVNPASSVADAAGNADDSSAVTIGGLLNILAFVSIAPATATGTVGTAMSQSFTASALSTAATTMTSSCTFTWSISPTTGRGTLSSTSGTTVTYTLPATGVTAGTAVITVTAVKTGTTTPSKTDTSTVTVGTATAADTTAPTATLTAPEAGARTSLVVTFNEVLNALTLAITDINDLLASATNDALGTPVAISVASVASSVSWNTTNVNAPVATITIPSTTFVLSRIVRLNFVTDHVQDLKGNAILSTTNVDSTVVDTTAPTAPTAVTLTPVGGNVVANTVNGTNTNLTFAATITAGEATGGKAEFYVGATKIGTDTTVLVSDTTVTFNPAYTTTTELQAGITAGGVVTCKLYDAAGNVITSTASNPTLIVDYVAPIVVGGVGTKTLSTTSAQITFSENIIITTPAVGRFAGAVGNSADTTTAPSVANAVVTLTFTSIFTTGTASVVDYTPLEVGNAANLKDAAGNEVAVFTDKVLATGFQEDNEGRVGSLLLTIDPVFCYKREESF